MQFLWFFFKEKLEPRFCKVNPTFSGTIPEFGSDEKNNVSWSVDWPTKRSMLTKYESTKRGLKINTCPKAHEIAVNKRTSVSVGVGSAKIHLHGGWSGGRLIDESSTRKDVKRSSHNHNHGLTITMYITSPTVSFPTMISSSMPESNSEITASNRINSDRDFA